MPPRLRRILSRCLLPWARSPSSTPYLTTFVEGYRAKGMTRVEGARVPGASHFVVADNPEAVADLIEHNAGN